MSIDELRNVIWEHLFLAKASKSIDELAMHTDRDPSDVRDAVNHEWFNVQHERVSIAYAAPSRATFAK